MRIKSSFGASEGIRILGIHIPIFSREKSKSNNIDIIIVFAYEYFMEIKELTKNYNCEYFQPIPFRKLS